MVHVFSFHISDVFICVRPGVEKRYFLMFFKYLHLKGLMEYISELC